MKYSVPIITSAPIEYNFLEYDIYDSFDLVSQGLMTASLINESPIIIKKHKFKFDINNIKKIYTAIDGQTLKTAELIIDNKKAINTQIIPLELFNGVRFSMKNIITKKRFFSLPQVQALNEARTNFLTMLYHNNLIEDFDSVKNRIYTILKMLKKEELEVLCISHSFFIKLIEIYLLDNNCFDNLEKMIFLFCPEKKPYQPLTGIMLEK